MKYLITIYGDESGWEQASPEEIQAGTKAWGEYTQEIAASGVLVSGEGLSASATATTIRGFGGELVTTDGPFAETKEQLGGFYLIDVPDLDAALEWGRKIPARGGAVEVRPVMDYEASGIDRYRDEVPAS